MRPLTATRSIVVGPGALTVAGLIVVSIWVSNSAAGPLANAIILKPGTPFAGRQCGYIVRRGLPEGVRIPMPNSGPATIAALSPDHALVAYTFTRFGEPGVIGNSPATHQVAVADTTGNAVATFIGGVRIAWSPGGEKLAVAIGCGPWDLIPAFDSVVVWEPGRGTTLSSRVPPSRGLIGWAGSDTVLVGSSVLGPAHALACGTGNVGPTHHRGTTVSPDGVYSVYPTMAGIGLGVFNDRTGSNFGYSLVTLLGISKLGDVGPAYWVHTSESGHTLALSACTPRSIPGGAPPIQECLTALVDVATLRLLGWTRGRLTGVTADSREAVVSRDGSLRFVGEQDWNRKPLLASRSPSAEERAVASTRSSARELVFAFTMQQIWCCDNGRLADALGYHTGTVYALDAMGTPREILSRPLGLWPSEAALNRSADLVAIAAHPSDTVGGSPSVLVADTSGALVAQFPERTRFRWSPDGSHLALIGDDLLVWDRRDGVVARLPFRTDDEAWFSPGRLMIRIQDRVTLLDWRSGDTTGTGHQAVNVSRDGEFSVDALHSWAGPRVFNDRMHAEITKCTWGEVHDLGWGLSGDPFWSREPHLPHDLWLNKCDARLLGMEEGRLDGCELALVDVERMEQIGTIPGKLIGRAVDDRSVVVLRGTDLAIVPLDPDGRLDRIGRKRSPDARGRKARIQVVVLRWSSSGLPDPTHTRAAADTVGRYLLEVASGDWLPNWSGFSIRCGRGMRVRRVVDPAHVEIEYDVGAFFADPGGQGGGLVSVGPGRTMTFRTRSHDAGRIIQVTTVP